MRISLITVLGLLCSCTAHFEIKNLQPVKKDNKLYINFESDHEISMHYFFDVFLKKGSSRRDIADTGLIKKTGDKKYSALLNFYDASSVGKSAAVYRNDIIWVQVVKPGKLHIEAESDRVSVDFSEYRLK